MRSSLAASALAIGSCAVAAVVVAGSLAGCPHAIAANNADGGPGTDGGVIACDDDEQCNGGFCLQGLCSDVQCVAKAQCDADQVCVNGACGAPPASCTSAEDCPGTEFCDGFSHTCFDPNHTGEGEGEGTVPPLVGEGEGEGAGVGEGEGEGAGAGEGEGEGAGAGEGEGEGGGGDSFDLSGFSIENRENNPVTQAGVFPDGTVVFAGHLVVVGRDATKADFEAHWGALPNNVLYINGGNVIPIVNGGEKFALVDANGAVVDGPTIAGSSGKSYQRNSTGSASSASSWDEGADSAATPGTTELPPGSGLLISEWSDASGTGNFHFEFVELSFQP